MRKTAASRWKHGKIFLRFQRVKVPFYLSKCRPPFSNCQSTSGQTVCPIMINDCRQAQIRKILSMNRRQFLGGTAAVSLAAAASFARAHDHHSHTGNHVHTATTAAPKAYEAARKAAAHCVEAGQICLAHCIALLSNGDTSMKDCSVAVNQMLALCGSLQNLAAQNSRLVPALAKVCLEACKQCSAACKVHAGHHAECKACYKSCLACIKECEKIAA